MFGMLYHSACACEVPLVKVVHNCTVSGVGTDADVLGMQTAMSVATLFIPVDTDILRPYCRYRHTLSLSILTHFPLLSVLTQLKRSVDVDAVAMQASWPHRFHSLKK